MHEVLSLFGVYGDKQVSQVVAVALVSHISQFVTVSFQRTQLEASDVGVYPLFHSKQVLESVSQVAQLLIAAEQSSHCNASLLGVFPESQEVHALVELLQVMHPVISVVHNPHPVPSEVIV